MYKLIKNRRLLKLLPFFNDPALKHICIVAHLKRPKTAARVRIILPGQISVFSPFLLFCPSCFCYSFLWRTHVQPQNSAAAAACSTTQLRTPFGVYLFSFISGTAASTARARPIIPTWRKGKQQKYGLCCQTDRRSRTFIFRTFNIFCPSYEFLVLSVFLFLRHRSHLSKSHSTFHGSTFRPHTNLRREFASIFCGKVVFSNMYPINFVS